MMKTRHRFKYGSWGGHLTRLIRPAALGLIAFAATVAHGQAPSSVDWPAYQGGRDSNQYSSLDQITTDNVNRLEVAWTYRSGDGDEKNRSQIQCNPIVIDGVLYGSSPALRIFALDAATGTQRWIFNPFGDETRNYGAGVNRGLVYWADGGDRRILFSAGSHLYALDADSGEPVESFGEDGRIDLHDGLGRDVEGLHVSSTTPGVIYRDLIIVGMRLSEGLPAAPGHIRGYNVRTGAIEWTFHTIPHPGEFGYETWPPDAYLNSGGANAWAGMSVDPERGIVYVPTGSAAYDFYGADRPGANLFANTLIALDAATGERIWHYQIVRHDLWDRDLPAPPNLLTVDHDGKRIDAVAQITKSGHVFLFDRATGAALFPIEEVPAPPSDLRGEWTAPTQPLPTKPPPFSRQALTEENVTDISQESRDAILDQVKRSRTGAQFIPPSREGTIVFPGFDGGGEWGGAAVDPESAMMYVNASEMPWMLTMIDVSDSVSNRASAAGQRVYTQYCLYCHGVDRKGDPLEVYPNLHGLGDRLKPSEIVQVIRDGRGTMPSFAHIQGGRLDALVDYLLSPGESPRDDVADSTDEPEHDVKPQYAHTGYIRFVDKDGYPAVKPPWGTLNAIDLNKGEIAWSVTLGEVPELSARGLPPTGTENYGGPVVTKGGVVLIAATKDEKFRAFDARDGKLLWETKLPAGGYATPTTYSVGGRQYVVIASGGGKMGTPSGDAYVAFALPE